MAACTGQDLLRYVQRYIIGQPNVTGVLISPKAVQEMGLTPETLFLTGR